tara:strand:+ start:1654 stop:2772 length:1119 start_codon:yes stop_codon:yes gene_type:complete
MQFKDVIGQAKLKEKLIYGVRKKKISHAQLFLGDPGYGSLGLAMAFAQFILCENKTAEDSCGQCPSCRKINELQHPDLHFSFPTVQSVSKTSKPFYEDWRGQIKDSSYFSLFDWIKKIDSKERKPIISVDESYDIQRKLKLKSYEGGYKIMIIWMAEEMNTQCANKILKILEEPPNKTMFILLSKEEGKLLDTIISRCQILRVNRISEPDLKIHIEKDFQLNTEEADSIASYSEGNIIKAKEILNLDENDYSLKDHFIELMRSSYKKNVIDMMNWADQMAQTGKERQKIFLLYTSHMLRQSIIKNYAGNQNIKVSEDEFNFLDKFSPFINGKNIRDFMKSIDEAYYQLERNANAKILFTLLCFQSMRMLHKA